jgi:hypothetical protein
MPEIAATMAENRLGKVSPAHFYDEIRRLVDRHVRFLVSRR